MEISVVDMVYRISVNMKNPSEKAALLAKYLPLESASDHDSFTFTAHVVTLLALGHLKFLAVFTCSHLISNLL